MPTITTDTVTRTTTINWTPAEVSALQWMFNHAYFPTAATLADVPRVMLGERFQQLKDRYLADIASRRAVAYDAASPATQATSDAAIGFNPNA